MTWRPLGDITASPALAKITFAAFTLPEMPLAIQRTLSRWRCERCLGIAIAHHV
ncbi:MAG: hypothetical protein R2845_10770 [Thermomicrobiales bacterium]